jgi:hypothetical protein
MTQKTSFTLIPLGGGGEKIGILFERAFYAFHRKIGVVFIEFDADAAAF